MQKKSWWRLALVGKLWEKKKKNWKSFAKPFGQSKEKIVHRLNEVIYESESVHLIWKKNGRCFGYIRRPYGQGEK
jgi:hypothetical protein